MIKRLFDTFIPHRGNSGHPHALRHHGLLLAGLIAILLVVALSTLTSVKNYARLSASVYSSVLIDLTNADRLKKDINALAKNDVLTLAAQMKADDMAKKSYFAHISPEGLNSWYWFRQAGYSYSYAGENLAVDFTESDDVERAWMNSPTHKANILDEHFSEIGIATSEGIYNGKKTIFVAQMFGAPAKAYASIDIPVAVVATDEPASSTVLGATQVAVSQTPYTRVVLETEDENNLMIVGINENADDTTNTSSESNTPYTSWYQRLLLQFATPLGIILIVVGVVLMLSFLITSLYHQKVTKHFFLGALIAFTLILLGYVFISVSNEATILCGSCIK